MNAPQTLRSLILSAVVICGVTAVLDAGTVQMAVQVDQPGVRISPTLYGISFEEINCAGDGGIYAEMVRNRSFEDSDQPDHWSLVTTGSARGEMAVDSGSPMSEQNRHVLRSDLAQMLIQARPSFVRFPGGCWVEGDNLSLAYHWKQTIGDVAARRNQYNIWRYYSTHGLGFHEYLQMCEDLGAEPLFVINCGMSHRGNVPLDQMGPWVQDALDAIEYANGPVASRWGAVRARNGHPAPFHLRSMEIGNENGGRPYSERYPLFYRAIKARYPEMRLIADVWGGIPQDSPVDIVDEHYYNSAVFFMNNASRYDRYDRHGPKVYVGEYAVTQGCGNGNLRAALGEAAFMTGLERNSDVVVMASYAPLFANINYKKWNPDLINFNGSKAYGTPSYYVQKMFSENRGDFVLPVHLEAAQTVPVEVGHGAVGLGTWNTQAEYKDIKVTRDGETLLASDLNDGSQGWRTRGGNWQVKDGAFQQTAGGVDRRAVAGNSAWRDYIYALKARKLGGVEGFLIMFRVQDDQNWFWWNLGGWGNTQHAIEHSMDGDKSILGQGVPGEIETGRWYDICIELHGPRVRCYLDGKLIHDATMAQPQPMYAVASRVIQLEFVVATAEDRRAFIYDAGLAGDAVGWRDLAWMDTEGKLQHVGVESQPGDRALAVRHRTVIAESAAGAVAVFPTPHQYQFPRDLTDNYKFVWAGRDHLRLGNPFGLGIRQDPAGGGAFVPWFNAPPGTNQRLGFFLLLTRGGAGEAMRQTLRYTHGDRFVALPGRVTFTSHYHMAVAVTSMDSLARLGVDTAEVAAAHAKLPLPDWVRVFKGLGVEVVHLAEFHGDGHPRDPGPLRLAELRAMFAEAERLSGANFLVLPGEEGNDFLGVKQPGKHPGHWMCLFPKPVYWTMQRRLDQPRVDQDPKFGAVYHVGDRADMIELLRGEHGLAWSAHPRIKASSWTPDIFRREEFYRSEVWLGGGWKAMPADLSRERLGERGLNLLDDMANWGQRKYLPGEVDVFKIDHTHELYGHMNINYLRLRRAPRFEEGWQPILDTLRSGKFFTTTGEVLIREFEIGGRETGQSLALKDGARPELRVRLEWTFPLRFAEVISGDGARVFRERIDLSDTDPFGSRTLRLRPELKGRKWVRFEAWDVAADGAYTQPIWLTE